MLGDCKPFMFIESVIVSTKYRGKGIGRKLIEEIELQAKRRDCYLIQFVSSGYRKEAHKFYEAVGYKLGFVEGFRKILK